MRTLTKTGLAAVLFAMALAGCATTGTKALSTTSSSYGGPSAAAATAETTVAPPAPASFALQVIETRRQCFGSAGCLVGWRIVPTWVGMGSAPTSSFTLLYEVVGLDDTQTGNIVVTNGRFNTEAGSGDTQDGVTLTARVTQVLED